MKHLLSIFSSFAFLCSFADVTCIWNGSEYVCSGEGSSVIVEGGGGLAPVVTNVVGVCTNCSAIAPADLRLIASQINLAASQIGRTVDDATSSLTDVEDSLLDMESEISTYQNWLVPPNISVANTVPAVTNYMYTANNQQAAGMQYAYNMLPRKSVTDRGASALGAGNGIYYYANNIVLPQIQSAQTTLSETKDNLYTVGDTYVPTLLNLASQLEEGAVECQASTNGNEGSSSVVTNVITGNWCTYDQGEAIKELLDELKSYTEDQLNNIRAISNFTEGVRETIATGLFSQYTAIPADTDWQTLYLNGASTDWGYSPTNTLQRLEVLLFGLAGVTNSTLFTDEDMQSEGMQDRFEDESQSISNGVSQIVTDASEQEVQSLGSALVALFRAFSRRGESLQNGEVVLPSVSLTVGEQEVYVPSFVVDGGVDMHNQLQTAFSLVFTVLYSLGAAFVIFFYWRWFADKAITFSKWGVELVSSMFAQ